MAYEYDVFLSYSRQKTQATWVNDVFFQLFKDYLTDAVNIRSLRIFQDTTEITSADDWTRRIKRAIATSKCMVCIWCPSYFNSEWCLRELSAMLHRETQLGLRTIGNPSGLIHPIKTFDGEHFPDWVQHNQCQDYREYFYVGEAFSRSQMYLDFQKSLQNWVTHVADGIQNAPRWRRQWLEPSWLDEPYTRLPKSQPRRARKPTL